MKEILEKMKKVRDVFIAQKKDGLLRLFILTRPELSEKWDVLISADWMTGFNSEQDLVYAIEEIKKGMDNNLDFLSSVIVLGSGEPIVGRIAQMILKENGGKEGEIASLRISDKLILQNVQIVHFGFSSDEISGATDTEDGKSDSNEEHKEF